MSQGGRRQRFRRGQQQAVHRHRRDFYAKVQASQARGQAREGLVERALKLLQQWGCIAGYQMSERNDPDDAQGIDARIFTLDQSSIRFQIKGSQQGVRKHRKKYPHIPCVNVGHYTYAADVAVLIQQQFKIPERPTDIDATLSEDTDDNAPD